MASQQYRAEEISTGRKIFWALTGVAVIVVSVIMITNGRQMLRAKADSRSTYDSYSTRGISGSTAADDARRANQNREAAEETAFSNAAASFASIPGLRTSIQGRGYLKGKVVLIDRKNKTLDSLNSSLPTELRARRASEVGTIVWLDWDELLVGTYEGGGGGYVYTCNMTIIDNTTRAKIATRSFRGTDPPDVIYTRYGSGYGDRPDIVGYLQQLPRK